MKKKRLTEEEKKGRKKKYYQLHKEEIKIKGKKYRGIYKEEIKIRCKKYYKNNKEKIVIRQEKYREEHKEILREKSKKYYQNHKEERKVYENNKRKINVNYKLANNLRRRIGKALRNNQKAGSAVQDLGCSVPELKLYLEDRFQPGMTWDNYGYYGWHVDHIIPLDSFDLTNREEFLKACHYKNLQPLWAEENYIKSDKLINTSEEYNGKH